MTEEKNCLDSIRKCGILGVSRIAAQIKDASVIVHGPKGCVLPAFEASLTNPLSISYTEMCRETTVFGGEDDIAFKIRKEYFTNNPRIIVLISSCASEIIGDDIKGVIHSLNLDIPIITVEGGSFINDHISGCNTAMERLVHELGAPRDENSEIVNIIPPVEKYSGWKDDGAYLVKLLGKFGISARVLFCGVDVDDIRKYPSAALNVIIDREYGSKLAEYMNEEYGIPYISCGYPIGLEATDMFVSSVLRALGRESRETDEMRDMLLDEVRQSFRNGLGRVTTFRYLEEICDKKKIIVGNYDTSEAFLRFLVKEFDDNVETVIVKAPKTDDNIDLEDRLKEISSGTNVIFTDDRGEIIDHIRNNDYDVILGSDNEYLAAHGEKTFAYINVEYPWARKIDFMPDGFAGYEGLLRFIEVYYNKIADKFDF